jgi:serine/threonine protein kinase
MRAGSPPFNRAKKTDPHYGFFMNKREKYINWVKDLIKEETPDDPASEEFLDLITKMFEYNPKDRLSIK